MNHFKNISKGRLICLFFVFIFLQSCKSDQPLQQKLAGSALGTTYHISYLGEEIDSLESSIDSIVFVINHSLSTYQDNSLISCFNLNSDTLWENPNELNYFETDMFHFKYMIRLSKEISEKTKGAFDPSSGCLFNEYSRAKVANELMNDSIIKSCLQHQGMDKITFDSLDYPFKLDSFAQLNFNAIAKGYLVDQIGVYFNQLSVKNFMIEVGGEVITKGMNQNNQLWKVGINTPLVGADPFNFFEIVELKDQALATSGNYQNFYIVDNELIGHTIDPQSGKPIINELRSASVLNKSCAVADAYATAFMTLGFDESKKIISSDTSLSAFLIYEKDSLLQGVFVQ
ncbi:MAG: FAD:protein FMN transferase [Bacteroidia bacterium]|nr:FAD:protein FMN transferase [Bacteroidia bacterium]